MRQHTPDEIERIKRYRDRVGCTLRHAAEAVERDEDRTPPAPPSTVEGVGQPGAGRLEGGEVVTCDNCGMVHGRGENRLCNGPFIYQATHNQIVQTVGQQAYIIRNQFQHRIRQHGLKMETEDIEVIIGCIAVVEGKT